jgi:hypothetical protein
MREIVIYGIAAVVSLAILGYSIHMLVGGLVSAESEKMIISGAILAGVAAIAFMARDIVRTRSRNSHNR